MNVLVVDDQIAVVSGLINGLHWGRLQIDQVYPAYSADEARGIFAEHTVDIMLCDIEMPRENGLSLFRWVKSVYPQTECVFLTAHAEFKYAQEALTLGSFDYILQPARYEEIEKAIHKARGKVLQNGQLHRVEAVQTYREEFIDGMAGNYLQDMMYYPANAGKNLNKILLLESRVKYENLRIQVVLLQIISWKSGHNEWESELLRRSILNIFQDIFNNCPIEPILLKYDRQSYVLLICMEDQACSLEQILGGLAEYQQFETKHMVFSSAIYVSDKIELTEFRDKLNFLFEFAKKNIMRQSKIFFLDRDLDRKSDGKISLFHTEHWDELIASGKGDQIKREIVSYFENPCNQVQNSADILSELHCGFTKALFSVLQKNNVDIKSVFNADFSIEEYMNAYSSYETFIEAIDYFLRLQNSAQHELNPLEEEDKIRKVIQYIRDNLDKKITRKDVSEYIYINEDYLSRLFKKKTGYMIKEYILMEKINLAKELLKSTNMSVSLIALKVGFNNFSHFSQTFRKLENLSPIDYRNLHQCQKF